MTSINENKLLSRGNSNIQQKWAVDSIKSEPQPEDTKPQLKMPMWSLTKEESENLLNMWNTSNFYLGEVFLISDLDKKDLLVEADLAKSVELQFNPTSDEITYRKDIKLIPTDNTHCSTLGDIVDIANQKLDFSMLCQQSNSYIYTMGGFVEDSQCFVEKYDLQKGKWEIAGTFYNNRTKFCSLVLPQEGTILIMGGKMVSIFLGKIKY